MKKIIIVCVMSILSSQFAVGQIKKYCYSNNTGEYAMSLYDDGSKKQFINYFLQTVI